MNISRVLRGGLAVAALSTLGLAAGAAPAQASPSASAPTGYITRADSVGANHTGNLFCGTGTIEGYAIDPDDVNAKLSVHVYVDPERDGSYVFYGAFVADQAYPNGHGFQVDNPFSGGNLAVYAIGVDSNGEYAPGEAVALTGDTDLTCGI